MQLPPVDLLSFFVGVLAATIPQVVNTILNNRFLTSQEKQKTIFLVEQEQRAEQRQREAVLWDLEFSKFQSLERLLNEIAHTAIFADGIAAEELRIRLWQTIEQLYTGFPNYEDLAGDLAAIEPVYMRAVQNKQAHDFDLLRERCTNVIKTCRTALVVGLPIVIADGKQVITKIRIPPK